VGGTGFTEKSGKNYSPKPHNRQNWTNTHLRYAISDVQKAEQEANRAAGVAPLFILVDSAAESGNISS
jgi:hypothetical protein